MTELQQYAAVEAVLVFDGQKLHKNAFVKRGKPTDAHAALVAGKLVQDMTLTEKLSITERMTRVKKGFANRVQHIVGMQWVEKAKKLGMKSKETGLPITTLEDVLQELSSNSTMETFQTWYALCYKDSESGADAKKESEAAVMKEMKVQYHDNTMVDGCVGPLRVDTVSTLMERLQAKSKAKQWLHVVKSKPGGESQMKGKRRERGDYYIIRSDKKGKMLSISTHNVCPCVFGKLLAMTVPLTLTFPHVRNASIHFMSVKSQYQDIENRGLLQVPAFNEQYCQVSESMKQPGMIVSSENSPLVSNMITQPAPVSIKAEAPTETEMVNFSESAVKIPRLGQETPQPCCGAEDPNTNPFVLIVQQLEQKRQEMMALAEQMKGNAWNIGNQSSVPFLTSPSTASSVVLKQEAGKQSLANVAMIKGENIPLASTKNEKRKAMRNKKREDEETQACLMKEQEEKRKESAKSLLSSVNKVEQQRSRMAKNYKPESKVTIKKHSMERGYLDALVQVGKEKEVWLPVFQFWQPHYVLSHLPEWHDYCKKKVLPDDWKNLGCFKPNATGLTREVVSMQGIVATNTVKTLLKQPPTENKVVQEQAECVGHVLNSKGRVWMKLKWFDEKVPDSIHDVRGVMFNKDERQIFGKTWMEYCRKIGLEKDLVFADWGYSIVKSIIGHEWLECGRPVVEVEWRHGERSKEKVMDLLDTSKDQNNGFNLEWNAYCDNLGDIVSGIMPRGLVDKKRKVNMPRISKKKCRTG